MRFPRFGVAAPVVFALALAACGKQDSRRDRDSLGGTYVLFLTARHDGPTDVDLVANKGT